MSTAGLINRYVWFVTTIYNRGPISLEEIQHRFESHFGRGEELSERQFHRYTDAVEELFDIEIKYSRSQRGYVVADREGIDNMGMRKWLIQTFSVNNILHESQELKNRILLENVPSGQQHLTTIVDAMRESVALSMTYHSFHRDEPSTFEVEPYCVKLFEQRWYMLGKSEGYTRRKSEMPATVTAIINQKGGTGKTCTCANLGVGLAREGKKVLLVDFDPQSSLTISLGYDKPDDLPVTVATLMSKVLDSKPVTPGEGILHQQA